MSPFQNRLGERLTVLAASMFVVFAAGAAQPPQPDSVAATLRAPLAAPRTDRPDNIYVVVFSEAPLAAYRGSDPRFPAPPRQANGRLRDSRGNEAKRYVDHLDDMQRERLDRASQAFGRTLAPVASFKHALNAAAVRLHPSEAVELAGQPGVVLVEPYGEAEVNTDLGPGQIGAPAIWSGVGVPGGAMTRGEGVVVGMIDSGINFDSPSFLGTEPGNSGIPGGYVHVNPLGDGNYLGTCRPGGVDSGLCNSKLIGAYDMVFTTVCNVAPPAAPCPATLTDDPTVEDNTGHGSHTSGTAAGNAVTVTYRGNALPLSGVAHRANVVHFDVCYQPLPSGNGTCPFVSSIAAVDRAILDNVVDVLSFSIGGGASPWSDTVSAAFLNASNAGIVVVASAGNSGPGPSTLGHNEPWVTTVGATTTSRAGIDFFVSATGPGSPPANVVNQRILLGGAGADFTAPLDANIPLIVSPGYLASPTVGDDGCAPYPAGTFAGGIAVIRRGTCSFTAKAQSAANAGAVAVLLANNDANLNLGIIPGLTAPAAPIPAFGLTAQQGLDLRAFDLASTPTVTASVTFPAAIVPGTADTMANFSSRGPSGFDLVKPDVGAPGVAIIAPNQGAGNAYQSLDGTSMAAPHVAGAAALLRDLYPTWTPSEIKSALQLTAKSTALPKENGTTPSDPHDRGAGRIDLSVAARTGFVLGETGANFLAANPAIGGQPSTLNLASLGNQACVGSCVFNRTLRSVLSTAETYTLSVTGLPMGSVTFSPTVSLNAGATVNIGVSVDSSLLAAGFNFGELVFTPGNGSNPTLHMPIAVRAAAPDVQVAPTGLSVSQATNTMQQRQLTISNTGNPTLNWSFASASQNVTLLDTPQTGSGFLSSFYNGLGNGDYVAEDFLLQSAGTVRTLRANGFVLPGGALLSNVAVSTGVRFRVYADNNGVPAGNPESNLPADAPLYDYDVAANATGVSVATNNISLNLTTAGVPPLSLPAGRYWLLINAKMAGSGTPLWAWRTTTAPPSGNLPKAITPSDPDADEWATLGGVSGLSTQVTAAITCGVPWATPDVASAALGVGGSSTVNVTFDSTGFAPGTYAGYLCVAANDPDEALTLVPVQMTVDTNNPPRGVGFGAPATAGRGGTTLLTVTVTPGTNPDSTGLQVIGDLTSIGGLAAQAFFDNGTNGDVVAGDNVFSYRATVGFVPAGSVTLPITVSDAQARSSSTAIFLTVATSTAPSAFGRATPATALAGASTVLAVTVTNGTGPTSTNVQVRGNLTPIGLGASVVFFNDGSNGDVQANDNVWTTNATIAPATTAGAKALAVTITDAEARTGTASIALTVTTVLPTATNGLANPVNVAQLGTTLLTVAVAPGASPASTGLGATVNLTSIGGSATQQMFDNATNGDVTAGDGVYSYLATVAAGTAPGAKTFAVTVTDTQARTATTNIAATVITPGTLANTAAVDSGTVAVGVPIVVTALVTPGTNPASTGLVARVDLSSIGGSANQAMYDDATNGDATAADNTFSTRVTVPFGTSLGVKTFTVTVTDAQGRTSTAQATLEISGDGVFGDDFEDAAG